MTYAKNKILLCFLSLTLCVTTTTAQNRTKFANKKALKKIHSEHQKRERQASKDVKRAIKEKRWELSYKSLGGSTATLVGFDAQGYPFYEKAESNVAAAGTTRANSLYTGGSLGLNLSGSTLPIDAVGIFEGSAPLSTHVEFAGKNINVKHTGSHGDHATHVMGTIAANGINPTARGMIYGVPGLYAFGTGIANMSLYGDRLLLSNHSYGTVSGWDYNSTGSRWSFYGRYGDFEDYRFGYYNESAADFDEICYNAPFYLPIKSAGNHRNDLGPAVGAEYYGYGADGRMQNLGPRPPGIPGDDGFDRMATYNNAKNILTVGAVTSLPNGALSPQDIVLASFSSWGPTDDGRIKPDVVANGVGLLSSTNASTTAYAPMSGTSMSTPNALGTLGLLQELWAQKNNGDFMLASTLKGLTIATTSEAGPNPGPDYMFGWGLVNAENAGKAILNKNVSTIIREELLTNGQTYSLNIIPNGTEPLKATICWTDPKGPSVPIANALNNRTLMLVNDLDMRVSDGTATYFPWTLDPANPNAAASKSDNFRDNVEQILIENPVPGRTYTLTITHKNSLSSGKQKFSLVITGTGGAQYCVNDNITTTNFSLSSISLANYNSTLSSCDAYVDKTTSTIQVTPGKPYPIVLNLTNCNASMANKVIKTYIDFNNDGAFHEADELVLNSGVISSNIFSGILQIPSYVNVDYSTRMRFIIAETGNSEMVTSCNFSGAAQIIDFKADLVRFNNDLKLEAISLNSIENCPSELQSATITVRNEGLTTISSTVINLRVFENEVLTSTYSTSYVANIETKKSVRIPMQSTFTYRSGKTYRIEASIVTHEDENIDNNNLSKTFIPSNLNPLVAENTNAFYCADNNNYVLTTNAFGTPYWYKNATDITPIAIGKTAVVNQAPSNGKYFLGLNDYISTLGYQSKALVGAGSYRNGPKYNLTFQVNEPSVIKSVKLYVGESGKVPITVTKDGRIIQEFDLYVTKTRTTTTAAVIDGNTNNDANDVGAIYNVNIAFPEVGEYIVSVDLRSSVTRASLFRNNISPSVLTYPINSSFNEISLIKHDGATGIYMPQYYLYFYDMKIEPLLCKTERTEVLVSSPILAITKHADTLYSSIPNGNQWYLNGVAINGATGSRYTATSNGNYSAIVNLPNTCIISSAPLYVTLPVSITNFSAKVAYNNVTLSWTTSNETNNNRFEVYRLNDGITTPKYLGKTAGKGKGNYSFLDVSPFVGINYYELHQIDNDGRIEKYGPIAVDFGLRDDKEQTVFPVPAKDEITVKTNSVATTASYVVKIFDLQGKLIKQITLTGSQLIKGSKLNIVELKSGVYLLDIVNIFNQQKISSKKLIKY